MINKLGARLGLSVFLAICPACNHASMAATQQEKGERINFAPAPMLRQKYGYLVVNQTKVQSISKDPRENESEYRRAVNDEMLELQSNLEIEVTAVGADGEWTLSNKVITKSIRLQKPGKEPEYQDPGDVGFGNFSFGAVLGKDGSLEKLPAEAQGFMSLFGIVNPLLLLPTILLPKAAVVSGETWPFEISRNVFVRNNHPAKQTIKGNGVLKSIRDGQAMIEFEYSVDTQDAGRPFTIHRVKSNAAYDLQKRWFLTNQLEVTCETLGWAFSDNDTDIKSIFTSSVKVEPTKP